MTAWRGMSQQMQPDLTERTTPMSQAAWCNINDPDTNVKYMSGHPFNSDDPDREHYTKTRTVNIPTGDNYGRPTFQERKEVIDSLDMCGYHSRKQAGLFNDPPPPAIEADIEAVEADASATEAEMWKAKYEAEQTRNDLLNARTA